MSEPCERGPFRTSASDDVHGSRAITMGLSPLHREQLERSYSRVGNLITLVAPFGCLAVLASTLSLGSLVEAGLLATLLGPLWIGIHVRFGLGARLTILEEALVVKDWMGRERRVAWAAVESFAIGRADYVEMRLRLEGELRTLRAPYVVD